MQVDAGLKKKGTEKLDWMYEGPASVSDGAAASADPHRPAHPPMRTSADRRTAAESALGRL